MTSKQESNGFSESFERQVYDALKFYGYNLPESDEEIESYVKMFGNTKFELPDSVDDADNIFDKFMEENDDHNITDTDVTAMAAQGEEGDILPDYIKKKIEDDIKTGRRVNVENNGNKDR
tara:strand:- start:3782 stop:4141 length:360 start_codon:yes stop_codon:yes gene_type:complete